MRRRFAPPTIRRRRRRRPLRPDRRPRVHLNRMMLARRLWGEASVPGEVVEIRPEAITSPPGFATDLRAGHGRCAEGGRPEHRRNRHRDPALPRRIRAGADRRPAPAHRVDALAEQGARRRPLAGRAARRRCRRSRATGGPSTTSGRIEARLNALPAVHDRDRRRRRSTSSTSARQHEDALPLIMTHGWPGSVDRAARHRRPADRPDRARRAAPRTRSTSCCRPCPATASPPSRPSSAGTSTGSRGHGPS